ncbi:LysR family transcriptional regulator [Bradyrhizobium canariense]|uniref:DNA-binding transcriptional regulator, LysR family n=1 Tax=Bradyrhizobium canariense TaxID=255045 RepID=A0A1H1RMX1_9BRAD|nr:LysR family transcriptional regulator [Bradyrhizobium canariense]SDS36886.1 DNA-binding transcriptional regulator, LysR family [Bradyrhizobium canariense]
MNDKDLKIFEAVARAGAIGRAATELNTVQSNVTAHLRELEQELGFPLFERHSRGVTLTAAGHRLRPFAIKIVDLLRQAKQAVQDNGTPRGPLAIGSMETTAGLRLPAVLAAYTSAFPDVDLSLVTGTTPSLTQAVLNRELDGALVAGPVDHPELLAETIFREQMVIIASPRTRSFAELTEKTDLRIVVLRSDCAYRRQLESILTEAGVVQFRVMEMGTIEGIIGCVAAGMGISLLPKGVVMRAVRDCEVTTFSPPQRAEMVDTVFIRRADAYFSAAMSAFLQTARPSPAATAEASRSRLRNTSSLPEMTPI